MEWTANNADSLTEEDIQKILKLRLLHKENLWNPKRFTEFDKVERIQVNKEIGFTELLKCLNKCLEEYFIPYTINAFDKFMEKKNF